MLVDRPDRRAVMIAADGAQLGATATLGKLSLTGAVELWHCVAVAIVVRAGTAFLKPASTPILPRSCRREELVVATALQEDDRGGDRAPTACWSRPPAGRAWSHRSWSASAGCHGGRLA
jgi:hypothetical protein